MLVLATIAKMAVIKVIGLSGAPTGQNDVDCASAALALVPEAASTE